MEHTESTRVAALVGLNEYREPRAGVFASEQALLWFIRQHKARLIEAGALLLISNRTQIDAVAFDRVVIEAGQRAAVARLRPPSPAAA